MRYKKFLSKLALILAVPVAVSVSSCQEDIDESNLYTFTGQTIESFLADSAQFSSFHYIIEHAGMSKVLSAYGTYTCFVPDNDAVDEYLHNLYNDENADIPHHGMTSESLEGLTDSLCEDIALYHLANSEVMGIDMGNGITISTMLGRDLNTSVDSLTGNTMVNAANIVNMDEEVENGVIHIIDHVLTRSNRMVSGEFQFHDGFGIFSEILNMTGLADSINNQYKTDEDGRVKAYSIDNSFKWFSPERCRMGYTVFAETDEALKEAGIESTADLVAYANKVYGHCADADDGWYDYARRKGIEVSTATDYKNPWNALNMFVRYHIIKYAVSYNNLTLAWHLENGATAYEYYETMLPFTMLKVWTVGDTKYVNRWVLNNTLTDQIAALGSKAMHPLKESGMVMRSDNIQAANGYIHPLNASTYYEDGNETKQLLIYDRNVPKGVLNERMRFDVMALLPEMMTNGYRWIQDSEVKALNGGITGKNDTYKLEGSYIIFPPGFFDNLVVYNGETTSLMYLPGRNNGDSGWKNYQGDEFLACGAYDIGLRLPPVPDETYEIRLGYSANGNRGMLQLYLGQTSDVGKMKALDIPLDMRHVPESGKIDPVTGWSLYTEHKEDLGVETDRMMHNLGYMRGPFSFSVNGGSLNSRAFEGDLRRILTVQPLKQGDNWLRFKTVLPDFTGCQFHLDYIELCPVGITNHRTYLEDMY